MKAQQAAWIRRLCLAITCAYWLVLFAGTHVPQAPLPKQVSDKTLHAGSYAVLGLMLATTWSLYRPFGWRQALTVLAILMLYGAFDETTQPLVGRHADVLDWVADVAGVAIALLAFLAARAVGQALRA